MSEKRTCPPKTPCPMDGFQTRCPKLLTDDCPAWHAWNTPDKEKDSAEPYDPNTHFLKNVSLTRTMR